MYSVNKAIFNFFNKKPNQFFYYSQIVKAVNKDLIKHKVYPKRSSTIDREVRRIRQKGVYVFFKRREIFFKLKSKKGTGLFCYKS